MEENFYNDDFEKYLQEQVKQHKMFPSDRVWRNINKSLHTDYKWPALTIAAFAFLAATIAVSVYFSPGPNIFAIPVSVGTNEVSTTSNTPLTSVINNKKRSVASLSTEDKTSAATTIQLQIIEDVLTEVPVQEQNIESNISVQKTLSQPANQNFDEQQFFVRNIDENTLRVDNPNQKSSIVLQNNDGLLAIGDKQILGIGSIETSQQSGTFSLATPTRSVNKKSRFSYQVYITPSFSYRQLKEDRTAAKQQAANIGGPVALQYVAGINQVVHHKPGTGMEAGVSYGYQLSKKLKVKAGVQLNARQYAIEAYRYSVEVATIAFMSGNGVDSLTSYSSFRTNNGYTLTELTNRYYQVSVPIGLEYEVVGNKNIQLNVAGTLQPTYMLSKNTYLISTDYKNYIENPGMSRSWNVNANIETFLSIKSGSFKWQVGPQFRYQTLPTSIKEYPIKEYLMDYGVKIGVIKNLQ